MSREEQVRSFLEEIENGLDKEKLRKIAPDIDSEDLFTSLSASIDYVTYFNGYQWEIAELSAKRFPIAEDMSDLSFHMDLSAQLYEILKPFDEDVAKVLIRKYNSLRDYEVNYFYLYALAYLGGDKAGEFVARMRKGGLTETSIYHFDVAFGIMNLDALVQSMLFSHESHRQAVYKALDELTWLDRALNVLTEHGVRNLEYGDKKLALKFFKKATKIKPKDFRVWHNIAKYYMRVGRFEESEENYQKAIDLEPRNPFVLNDYGLMFYLQKEYKQALVHFEQAHQLAPKNTMIIHYLGLVNIQLKNQRKAKEYFQLILKYEPYNQEAKDMLSMLH